MKELLILGAVIIYLIWIGLVLRRLLVNPLPKPVDIIHLSVFYYTAPLSLFIIFSEDLAFLNFPVTLNDSVMDKLLAQKTILLAIIASVSSEIGGRLGVIRLSLSPNSKILTTWKTRNLQNSSLFFCVIFTILVAVGLYLFSFDAFFSGYNQASQSDFAAGGNALIYFSFESLGLCAFVWFLCYRETKKSFGLWFIALSILLIVLIGAIRGKRLEILIALMPLMLYFWSVKFLSVKSRLILVSSAIVTVSAFASFRFGLVPDLHSITFNILSEGFYAGHLTPGVIAALERSSLEYENGLRLLAGFAAIIPRFILPDKDEFISQFVTDLSGLAPQGASTFLGEVYLQGGIPSIVIIFLTIGLIGRKVQVRTLSTFQSDLQIKVLFYIVFLCSFVPHFRDGLMAAIKMPIQLSIVIVLLLLMSRSVFVRRSEWPTFCRASTKHH